MSQAKTKKELLRDFEVMKSVERSARDMYLRISTDSRITDSRVKNMFRLVADDEQRHTELVEKIINIIQNTL